MMQSDRPVKIPLVKIERDKETQRVLSVNRIGTSKSFTVKNNAAAFELKQDVARMLARLKK